MPDTNSKSELRRRIDSLQQRVTALKEALAEHERSAEEQRRALDALARRDAELRATLYGIGDAVISTDIEGRVALMNQVAEKLTGWTEAEALGKPLHEVFCIVNEETRCQVESPVARVLYEGAVVGPTNHTLLISKDGREIHIADSGAPVFDLAGDITGVVMVFRDQTEELLARRFTEMRLSFIEYAVNHTLDELLTRVLDEVGALVNSPIGFYHFVAPDQRSITLQQWSTHTLKGVCQTGGLHYDIDQAGVWADCVYVKKPVIHNDYASLLHKRGMPEDHARVIRELVVPVMREDKVVAILGVGNKPAEYTQKDVEIVSFFADVAWEIACQKQAEHERLANLKFFESMDKVNRAMQGANDLEQMMRDLLDIVLSVFDCDRAFLLYPCDPEAPSWRVPMERNRPEYPGVLAMGVEVPMDADVAAVFRRLLNSDGPVTFGPEMPYPLPVEVSERFGPQSFMSMALYPKIDKPWQFGVHQCSYPRTWTSQEARLLQEIGRRLSDALTGLLTHRDLRKSEEFLNNIVENIPNMIFVKDAQTLSFIRFNKAGEQLLGYSREELIGKNDYDFFPKAEADFFTTKDREVLSTKALADIAEETIRNRRAEERILHTKKIPILDQAGNPQYLLGISEDITERKKLEARLRLAQKLEAVGQLAGGVAHDFNNMLGVIIGHAELALEQLDPDQPLFDALQEIRLAAERSADLTRQLLAFARKQTVTPKVLDLNETIKGMLKMLRRLIGEDIDLAWMPGAGVWPIKVDPSQIDQILVNLLVNARDAIAGVGRVTIETHTVTFDAIYCADHPGFFQGDFVMLAVSDDGSGMDRETLGKIFEPFFTTKAWGKGTGLGLATVYGIVKQNNGFINVYSEPGHGTTFKIYLPRHAATKAEPVPAQRPVGPVARGHETILLVEDEPAILEMTGLMLERLGYRVLTASTPGKGILAAKANAGEIHLLITDLVMPEMNGLELTKKIISIYPGIRHLFMSGYMSNVIVHHGVLDEGVNYIQKPFSMQALSAKVREVLESEHGNP